MNRFAAADPLTRRAGFLERELRELRRELVRELLRRTRVLLRLRRRLVGAPRSVWVRPNVACAAAVCCDCPA